MNEIIFDVMTIGGRFVCQVSYAFRPDSETRWKDLEETIYKQRPTLRGKKFYITPSTQRLPSTKSPWQKLFKA